MICPLPLSLSPLTCQNTANPIMKAPEKHHSSIPSNVSCCSRNRKPSASATELEYPYCPSSIAPWVTAHFSLRILNAIIGESSYLRSMSSLMTLGGYRGKILGSSILRNKSTPNQTNSALMKILRENVCLL